VDAPLRGYEQFVAGLLAASRQETTDALCQLPALSNCFEAVRLNLETRVERVEGRARVQAEQTAARVCVVPELVPVTEETEECVYLELAVLRRAAFLLCGLAVGSFGLGFLLGSH